MTNRFLLRDWGVHLRFKDGTLQQVFLARDDFEHI